MSINNGESGSGTPDSQSENQELSKDTTAAKAKFCAAVGGALLLSAISSQSLAAEIQVAGGDHIQTDASHEHQGELDFSGSVVHLLGGVTITLVKVGNSYGTLEDRTSKNGGEEIEGVIEKNGKKYLVTSDGLDDPIKIEEYKDVEKHEQFIQAGMNINKKFERYVHIFEGLDHKEKAFVLKIYEAGKVGDDKKDLWLMANAIKMLKSIDNMMYLIQNSVLRKGNDEDDYDAYGIARSITNRYPKTIMVIDLKNMKVIDQGVKDQLDQIIAEADAKIAEADAKIAEADVKIAEADVKIAEADAKIADLNIQIKAKKDLILLLDGLL